MAWSTYAQREGPVLRRLLSLAGFVVVAVVILQVRAQSAAAEIKSISPTSATVMAGDSTSATLVLEPPRGRSSLRAVFVPDGVGVTFTPSSGDQVPWVSTMDVTVEASATPGTYIIVVVEDPFGDSVDWALTITAPATPSPLPTVTATSVPTARPTPTSEPTAMPTPTSTPTATATPTPTKTTRPPPTPTATRTLVEATSTPSLTATPSPTLTPSATATPEPSLPTPTSTPELAGSESPVPAPGTPPPDASGRPCSSTGSHVSLATGLGHMMLLLGPVACIACFRRLQNG